MKAKKPNISIIIPVYNVEKLLVRCLDSVFMQEFTGAFEVIAVDDCSTDSSLQILKKYALNKKNLKIIEHGNNKSISKARTSGMLIAKGDYIMHVDCDDWILPGTLNGLYNKMRSTNADVISFNYLRENSNGKSTRINKISQEFIETNKIKIQKYFVGAVWNKIVKREFIKDLVYMQKSFNHAEDLFYVTEILIRANKFVFITDYYYVYFENLNSLTQTTTLNSQIQILKNITKELKSLLNVYKNQILIAPIFELRYKYSFELAIRNYFNTKVDFTDLIDELDDFKSINKLATHKLFHSPFYFVYFFLIGKINFREFAIFVKRIIDLVINKIYYNN